MEKFEVVSLRLHSVSDHKIIMEGDQRLAITSNYSETYILKLIGLHLHKRMYMQAKHMHGYHDMRIADNNWRFQLPQIR